MSLVAHSNQKHIGKGVLRNSSALTKLTQFKARTGEIFKLNNRFREVVFIKTMKFDGYC